MVIELIQKYPRESIILFGIIVSFIISIVQYFVLDKERMREIKAKQKSIQQDLKNHKDNPQKMMELQKEMMSHTMEAMKHSFKPMLITFIPIILLFAFLRNAFTSTSIASSWIWWYIGSSIISSLVFRKLFKLP